MRKILSVVLLAVVSLTACTQGYKKAGEGMEYKIIADGSGPTIKQGDYMEFNISASVSHNGKDTVLNNSRDQGSPQIIKIDSAGMPPAYYKLFLQLRKGDSLTTKTLTDSFFKKQPQAMPPFIHNGDYLITNIRITNIYKTEAEANKAREAGIEAQKAVAKLKADAQLIKDDAVLTQFFTKNNVHPVKTPKGAYVEIMQQGTGAVPDTTKFVKINYTGTTLAGKEFDSNTDSAKGHVQPLLVNLTGNPTLGGDVIPGMSDGLRMLSKGAKAKIYIPSALAYGPNGTPGGDIGPNENLIFEVEVLDILTTDQANAEQLAMRKKMMDARDKAMDKGATTQPEPGK